LRRWRRIGERRRRPEGDRTNERTPSRHARRPLISIVHLHIRTT
jgi:hypothetical protein